jgi:hypothetical protein
MYNKSKEENEMQSRYLMLNVLNENFIVMNEEEMFNSDVDLFDYICVVDESFELKHIKEWFRSISPHKRKRVKRILEVNYPEIML